MRKRGGPPARLLPRNLGVNPRNLGTNPKALGLNPRVIRQEIIDQGQDPDDPEIYRANVETKRKALGLPSTSESRR